MILSGRLVGGREGMVLGEVCGFGGLVWNLLIFANGSTGQWSREGRVGGSLGWVSARGLLLNFQRVADENRLESFGPIIDISL